ncbi:glycosyltransferase family 2 protein [Reinekea marinisedimentorum]|uniref:Glycosyltransferase involved in cell wall biosynthesis n=1 Tax=Reinekea marinisedimentorum TaxID=230495 RepID=A0A4R3I6I0_9GAMM|nr:glycosyltransferase family 2 protein [Reinekea marinisedimentorum]TCS41695.1 glycosyltransferase involved in cell wall biosynthesis [Reinekea marinisedimentorum]
MKFSVIIPAKNEAAGIGKLVEELFTLRELGDNPEVIVIDDGSTDGTGEAATKAGATVLRHPYSRGNGAAIKTGIRNAKGDYLIMMDADGQHLPSEIPKLIEELDENIDMVIGARKRESQSTVWRHMANQFYNKLATFLVEKQIDDLTSGFRIVDREKALSLVNLLPNYFSYPTTLCMSFFKLGYGVKFKFVDVKKNEGKSHIKPMKDGLRFVTIIFKIIGLYSPLRVFLPTALVFFGLGLVRYVFTFATSGTFTNMSAMLFSTSVMVFLMGLISEQISTLIFAKL